MTEKLRPIEIRIPTPIEGWAMDLGRITRVPDGWHAYTITETGTGPGRTVLSVRPHGTLVNHRMDMITTMDLDPLIASHDLDEIDGDDWGFVETVSIPTPPAD